MGNSMLNQLTLDWEVMGKNTWFRAYGLGLKGLGMP